MIKTVKVGGSSLASAERFENVKNIISLDCSRRAVVVSAPGKSEREKVKVTDMLISYSKAPDDEKKAAIIKRYADICASLGVTLPLDIEASLSRPEDYNYTVSRGEYLGACVMASYLHATFVDASDVIFFDENGKLERERSYEAIRRAYDLSCGMIVVPGFYGRAYDGSAALMERGGSDVTGALVAAALRADVYENWTDVPGILRADPRVVEGASPIDTLSFPDLASLTSLGASVLHPDAVAPVRELDIPINIRSTFEPEHPGTFIRGEKPLGYAVGVTAKKGFIPFGDSDSVVLVRNDDSLSSVSVVGASQEEYEKLLAPMRAIGALSCVYKNGDLVFTCPTDKCDDAVRESYKILFV